MTLHTSIKSIINQTYNNHELIILFDNPDLNDFINLKNKTIETIKQKLFLQT